MVPCISACPEEPGNRHRSARVHRLTSFLLQPSCKEVQGEGESRGHVVNFAILGAWRTRVQRKDTRAHPSDESAFKSFGYSKGNEKDAAAIDRLKRCWAVFDLLGETSKSRNERKICPGPRRTDLFRVDSQVTAIKEEEGKNGERN